jgi:hypothetical protein
MGSWSGSNWQCRMGYLQASAVLQRTGMEAHVAACLSVGLQLCAPTNPNQRERMLTIHFGIESVKAAQGCDWLGGSHRTLRGKASAHVCRPHVDMNRCAMLRGVCYSLCCAVRYAHWDERPVAQRRLPRRSD